MFSHVFSKAFHKYALFSHKCHIHLGLHELVFLFERYLQVSMRVVVSFIISTGVLYAQLFLSLTTRRLFSLDVFLFSQKTSEQCRQWKLFPHLEKITFLFSFMRKQTI